MPLPIRVNEQNERNLVQVDIGKHCFFFSFGTLIAYLDNGRDVIVRDIKPRNPQMTNHLNRFAQNPAERTLEKDFLVTAEAAMKAACATAK
jgi:hypothetical protein